jgi:hypothetical protein
MQWISVSERYPKDGQKVRIKIPDGNGNPIEFDVVFKDKEDYRSWGFDFHLDPEILKDADGCIAKPTHWMPLPTPPPEPFS